MELLVMETYVFLVRVASEQIARMELAAINVPLAVATHSTRE